MRRGTTAFYKRTYPEDLTGGKVIFCFWQGEKQSEVSAIITSTDYGCDVECELSQEQTLYFDLGTVYWQIRALKTDGTAIASEVYAEVVTDVHPNGVIEAPVTLGFFVPNETPEEPVEEEPEEPTEENWEDWQEREDEPAPEEEAEEGEE